MTNQIEEDEPLDPTLERVRKKMVRLLVISIGIMVVGLMAVFGAIVYKIGNTPDNDTALPEIAGRQGAQTTIQPEINLGLQPDARVISADLVGNRILLNVRLGDGRGQLLVINLERGEVTSRISLSPQP